MLDRPRLGLILGLCCLLMLAVLGWLVDTHWPPLREVDFLGADIQRWAASMPWLVTVLQWVETGFDMEGMTLIALVGLGWLWARNHRRAGLFFAGVILVTWVASQGVKHLVLRPRPHWQVGEEWHNSLSFPSGHVSTMTALAVLIAILAAMLLRKGSMRRLVYLLSGAIVALAWVDRLGLGRHYLTDVAGGTLLGMAVPFLGLAVFSPLPRSHAAKVEPLPQVYESHGRLTVILNPIKVEDVGAFRSIVTSMAVAAGWNEPMWLYTTIEDSGTGMAHQAAVDGADLVMVCGGDGTVREVCAELAGTGIPVGIIPAGTGNLLARNLDVPLFMRAAIDVALTGQDRAIDLVEVSGDGLEDTHFMVMAGMGFDAAIMEGVNEEIKASVGWIAYIIAGLKSLMFPAMRVEISIDGGPVSRHRARTVVVGNVGYLQAGMPLLPDAAIDDGVLDVIIVHPAKFLSWLPVAYRVLSRSRKADETLNRLTGQTVELRAHAEVPRQLDGDSIGSGRELKMTCIHGRLLVRVPRSR